MEIIQVILIALFAACIVSLLKGERPEIALQVSLATGIVIFLMMIGKVTIVIQSLQQMALKIHISNVYLTTILKIIGVSYLASFGIELCKDAGHASIASKIEFAGKIIIITLGLPILMAVLDMAFKILE